MTVEQKSNIQTGQRTLAVDINSENDIRDKHREKKKYAEIDCNHNDTQPFNVGSM